MYQKLESGDENINNPRIIIRSCLRKSFDIDSIRFFTSDYFPEVRRKLDGRSTLNEFLSAIIGHCDKNNNYDDLWEAIKVQHPRNFEEYYPRWKRAQEQYSEHQLGDLPEVKGQQPEQSRRVNRHVSVTDRVHLTDGDIKSNQPRKLQVFLCHGKEDKAAVRELYHKLRNDGFDPWLDEENLLPGQQWQDEISKAVYSSDVVLVCLSSQSVSRDGYIQEEIRFALDVAERQRNKIFLIPVRIEECIVPQRLQRWQWVNLFEEKGYTRLFQSLQERARQSKLKSWRKISRRQVARIGSIAFMVLTVLSLILTIGDSGINVFDRVVGNLNFSNLSSFPKQPALVPSSSFERTEFTLTENVSFDVVDLGVDSVYFTSLEIGPDNKLYGATNNGQIRRYTINADGTLSGGEILKGVAGDTNPSFPSRPRLLIGLTFDLDSTASDPVAWATHTVFGFDNIDQRWGGKISRLSGPNLEIVQDIFVNLPRSAKDHVTNSITYGPDGRLYLTQGSNLAAGVADNSWGSRPETLLTAAVLVFDKNDPAVQDAISSGTPIDVKTGEAWPGGNGDTSVGTYSPYATNAPLKIFATGVHNAYDLVWHSNGYLYVPTNGTAGDSESPDFNPNDGTDYSYCSTVRADGRSAAQLPAVDGINNNSGATGMQGTHETQRDFMFVVGPNGGGYFGHPNPARCEWTLNIGNPLADKNEPGEGGGGSRYAVGTPPDPNYRGYSNVQMDEQVYDFGFNKSPNGIIEYKSDKFDGKLQGRLLVARFSNNNDIIVIQVADDGSVLEAQSGVDVDGLGNAPGEPFNDPLEIAQNAATGDLYLAQYDRGGNNQKLWLLRPIE